MVARSLWIGLVLALLLVLPQFLAEFHLFQLCLIAGTALIVLGLVVVTGLAGQISLAQSAFAALGAYGATVLATSAGIPLWAGIVVTAHRARDRVAVAAQNRVPAELLAAALGGPAEQLAVEGDRAVEIGGVEVDPRGVADFRGKRHDSPRPKGWRDVTLARFAPVSMMTRREPKSHRRQPLHPRDLRGKIQIAAAAASTARRIRHRVGPARNAAAARFTIHSNACLLLSFTEARSALRVTYRHLQEDQ